MPRGAWVQEPGSICRRLLKKSLDPADGLNVQQRWEDDAEALRARLMEDLCAWRALILPLSAFANFLFFVSSEQLGFKSLPSLLSLFDAAGLTLWMVVIQVQIEGLSAQQGGDGGL